MLVNAMNIFPYIDVLVLDDDHLFCVWAEETLRLLGFVDVYTACSSAAGACILDHHKPAIVVVNVDRQRPEVWNTLAQTRHRGTLVIATSFAREDRSRNHGRTADAFLIKPYSKTQLLRTISGLLTGSAGRRGRIVPLSPGDRQRPAASQQAFERGEVSDFAS